MAATFARNSAQLGMIMLLLVTPIIMLSGTWVTVESMPPFQRGATMLSPLRHFFEIAYGILLRGSGLAGLCTGGRDDGARGRVVRHRCLAVPSSAAAHIAAGPR